MLKKFVRLFGGDPNKREIDRYSEVVEQINALEPVYEKLSDEALAAKTDEFRSRIAAEVAGIEDPKERQSIEREILDEILPEAFALVREASKRTLGLRHYDVQMIGGSALHEGKIAEMRTGEGKTLVATLPVYLNALPGRGVHLITVNDYLARRDARWMFPVYHLLGMSVGVLQMAARTENGRKAFLVDPERESPHEDQHQLRMVPRAEAYAADITYGTNSEFGFDYLRDNMVMRQGDKVQRGHVYAIIDEVDNVLIDEARTPLIISGPAQDESEWYVRMAQVVRGLRPEDYEIEEKDRTVTLTEIGETHVEEIMGVALRDPDRPEDVTPEQARLIGYLEQALRAQFLFRRNKDYLVQGGKVVIIDEFTGRLMPGRRWSDGLHQAVEAKEGAKVQNESVTYATITIQNYFRMYEKLSGMTGTALTEAEEFSKIYSLEVLAIPTNLEYQATRSGSGLIEIDGRDEQGYKVSYYTPSNDPQRTPVYWRRKDYPDVVYRTEEAKLRAIAQEILRNHVLGRPLLVGTTSVELSERVSNRLRAEPLRRLMQVQLMRKVWMDQNKREEDGRQIPELQFLNQPLEKLEISEMRRLGRDLGIPFNPEDPENLTRLLDLMEIPQADPERLSADLQGGIPHEVLNARKHTEESQIIAGAGAFGAVTIATNMAGRGVDIKLGGELAEEILASVNRVLRRTGGSDPYEMTMEQRRQALLAMDPADWGIYESEVRFFLQHIDDMARVRELGGLHVIGSERHEARRIDNQLRGRAARQGDPGSSRFYLSMEDELMRLFGGGQADSLMQRLKIDDALPIEMGMVSRIVEQSQTRVEGSNFDVRKHLLEYDDVLNTQRAKIYAQRNLIFTKTDLSEDVTEMLRTEVARRVPEALADEDGPWKLLAWLEQTQPPISIQGTLFPTFTVRLLAEEVMGGQDQVDSQMAFNRLLKIAADALDAEENHLLRTVQHLLEQTEERMQGQVKERLEAFDTFLEGLGLEDETDTRRPTDLAAELNALVRIPLKLNPEQLRRLRTDPNGVAGEIRPQIEAALITQAITRLVGSVERRLEEAMEINITQLPTDDWYALSDIVLNAIQAVYARRRERFLGIGSSQPGGGQIYKDLENALSKLGGTLNQTQVVNLLMLMPQGSKAIFDRKTHRKLLQRTTRLSYTYFAAHHLENRESDEMADIVLDHLEEAQAIFRHGWGMAEFGRLAALRMTDLDERACNGLKQALGEAGFDANSNQPLQSLPQPVAEIVIDELGRQALTEIYRQLLLSVITELWVEYLTQMEALRVSIGLEAYGQRDPLVQYKNRAFALFQELLSNMRLGVISRMFTYRPRDLSTVQVRSEAQAEAQAQMLAASDSDGDEDAAQGPDGSELVLGAGPALNEDENEQEPETEGAAGSSDEQGQGGKRKRRRRR